MFTLNEVKEAIKARKNGEWDNEQLLKLGELEIHPQRDIDRIMTIYLNDVESWSDEKIDEYIEAIDPIYYNEETRRKMGSREGRIEFIKELDYNFLNQ